jgi:hypothetical protein
LFTHLSQVTVIVDGAREDERRASYAKARDSRNAARANTSSISQWRLAGELTWCFGELDIFVRAGSYLERFLVGIYHGHYKLGVQELTGLDHGQAIDYR